MSKQPCPVVPRVVQSLPTRDNRIHDNPPTNNNCFLLLAQLDFLFAPHYTKTILFHSSVLPLQRPGASILCELLARAELRCRH